MRPFNANLMDPWDYSKKSRTVLGEINALVPQRSEKRICQLTTTGLARHVHVARRNTRGRAFTSKDIKYGKLLPILVVEDHDLCFASSGHRSQRASVSC